MENIKIIKKPYYVVGTRIYRTQSGEKRYEDATYFTYLIDAKKCAEIRAKDAYGAVLALIHLNAEALEPTIQI